MDREFFKKARIQTLEAAEWVVLPFIS